MAYRIILPKLGTNIEEARITTWLKKEGEAVSKGEPLVQIETDKASFEVEAEHSGILKKILCAEGSRVAITSAIAIIAEPDEEVEELIRQIKAEQAGQPSSYAKQAWKEWFSGKEKRVSVSADSPVRFSPAAKKLINEKDIDTNALVRHFAGRKKVLEVQDIEDFLSREKIVIYGAGLGAKQALEIISLLSDLEVVGLIDDNQALAGKTLYGYKVLGGFDYLRQEYKGKQFSTVALSFHSEIRKKIFIKLKKELSGIRIKTMIDPRAIISKDLEIGEGVFIEAGAVIGPGTKIGDAVIVDLGAVVCHDCFIGAYSHLSPGCSLSGIVSLGENVLVGVGASINSTVTIGKDVIITPGSAVMNDVKDGVIVSGIPAVEIGESRRGKE